MILGPNRFPNGLLSQTGVVRSRFLPRRCPVKEQRLRVAELYPELLELQHWQVPCFECFD